MNYPGSLPENQDINPAMMQKEQAIQQVAQNQEMLSETMDTQKINAIMEEGRKAMRRQDSAEHKSEALMHYVANGIKAASPSGGAGALAVQERGGAMEIAKRLFG